MIALHGFGDESGTFETIDPFLAQNKWIIALDLPFHGNTTWNKSECTREDMVQILRMLLERTRKNSCILLGFSLGGRLVLSLWPEMREDVERLILIAPDGVATNGLRWPEAIPESCRKFLRGGLLLSEWFLPVIYWLSRQTWLPVLSRQFARRHLNTPEKLRLTLNWWISLTYFPVSSDLVQNMAKIPVPVQVWIGSDDPLIHVQSMQEFWRDYPELELKVVPGAGHRAGFQPKKLE